MKKKKKKKKKKITLAICAACLFVLVGALVCVKYRQGADDRAYEKEIEELEAIRPDGQTDAQMGDRADGDFLADAKAQNADTVAWLTIPDTEIDFPVMYSGDNDYYLRHNFQKETNSYGLPFLDMRCNPAFTDFHSIIYGHHIKGGQMFSGLDEFKDEAYSKAHPEGTLTLSEERCTITFIACAVVKSDSELYQTVFLTQEEKNAYLELLRESALWCVPFDAEELLTGRIVTLSTCSYEYEDARTILVGYLK